MPSRSVSVDRLPPPRVIYDPARKIRAPSPAGRLHHTNVLHEEHLGRLYPARVVQLTGCSQPTSYAEAQRLGRLAAHIDYVVRGVFVSAPENDAFSGWQYLDLIVATVCAGPGTTRTERRLALLTERPPGLLADQAIPNNVELLGAADVDGDGRLEAILRLATPGEWPGTGRLALASITPARVTSLFEGRFTETPRCATANATVRSVVLTVDPTAPGARVLLRETLLVADCVAIGVAHFRPDAWRVSEEHVTRLPLRATRAPD